MATNGTPTPWSLKGVGYEFCNCNPGCTCNFSGFPTTSDGSCQAFVASAIESGRCGDVDLSGITVAGVIAWPKAIHDGGGKAVFIVPPAVTDEQLGALSQIFTGQLGGMPWEILGTTYEVAGLVRSEVKINEAGRHSSVEIPGVGRATGDTLKNPVTGEDNNVVIELEKGFIWKRGDCGQGSFEVEAEGLKLQHQDTNWIHYDFDWSN
jgi:hypothetical protein